MDFLYPGFELCIRNIDNHYRTAKIWERGTIKHPIEWPRFPMFSPSLFVALYGSRVSSCCRKALLSLPKLSSSLPLCLPHLGRPLFPVSLTYFPSIFHKHMYVSKQVKGQTRSRDDSRPHRAPPAFHVALLFLSLSLVWTSWKIVYIFGASSPVDFLTHFNLAFPSKLSNVLQS